MFQSSVTPAPPVAATCTGCKGSESVAVARCVDCANLLCAHCVMAHRFMHCFDGHRVHTLDDPAGAGEEGGGTAHCPAHPSASLLFYCRTCDDGACATCAGQAHATHDCQPVGCVAEGIGDALRRLAGRAKTRATELRAATNNVEQATKQLQVGGARGGVVRGLTTAGMGVVRGLVAGGGVVRGLTSGCKGQGD